MVVTHSEAEPKADLPKFSPREQQVLVLLGEGMTTAQIAIELGLSARTIRGYVANMKRGWRRRISSSWWLGRLRWGLFRPEV